ncbi:class I SAM-dependent DNA methyltransferase [Streptomyces sp. HD]|uniref:class I SAM-dependent DNA methyltransferase n=1 Tax=Streptomyces sp. HD TaxID=3020892 RepID=UPI00232B6536|nr:class I SAM-dependent methyltransferase [Streptomyces sp. HD]MDC0767174.1 class I SAM-dependent methyltransferase [Streptomyces sp. HD]
MSSPGDQPGYGSLPLDRGGQAEAFDAIGVRYDEAFPHKEGQVASADWLIRSLPAGARVLDLGCGTGIPTALQLAEAGLEVVGVDLSDGMVALARKNVPAGVFHRTDIADLRPGGPVDLGRFDAVVAFFSLLMLPRAEIPLALRTVQHLLAPDGLFALSMVEADVDDFSIPFIGSTIRVSGYLRDELREVVEAAHFEIVGETSYTYAPSTVDVPPEVQIFLRCGRRP